MKNILYTAVLMLLFLGSCEEYEMVDYGEGGEINFMGDYYRGERAKPYWVDEVKYLDYEKNFGVNKQGDSLRYDTINIGVKIMGTKTATPRRVVLTTRGPKENALEVIFPEEYYVPADTGVAVFKVVVKRPASRNVVWTTRLVFDYEHSDFRAGTAERQEFLLKAEDKVSLELWGMSQEEWDSEPVEFFGEWSETKMRFMMTLLGCYKFQEWFWSDECIESFYDNTLYNALEEYKSDPANPPLLDEHGEWIGFPNLEELM